MQRPVRSLIVPSIGFALCASVIAFAPATLTAQAAAPAPCLAPEYHQFDFWLGHWEVAAPAGQPPSTSHIESVSNGCAIVEHWQEGRPGAGVSINAYNRITKAWHQTWVGSGGGVLMLDGALRDGQMVLEGAGVGPRGEPARNRITWTPQDSGRVRQRWEQSVDSGKTWTISFDGLYVRAKG